MLSAVLIKQAGADGAFEGANLLEDRRAVLAHPLGFEHHVPDLAVGLIILCGDVDFAASKYVVEPSQHAGQVVLDLDETGAGGARRQPDLRKVDRAYGRADIAVLDQLARD